MVNIYKIDSQDKVPTLLRIFVKATGFETLLWNFQFISIVAQSDISPKELVPFTQLVKVRRGQLVLALPNIRFS